MDPLAIQAIQGAALRPSLSSQPDLAAVLREGRVLAGEVLQTLGGGSLLVGIGSHRVPARSQVEMQPGQRFLFEVQSAEDEVVLRVLDAVPDGEPELLRALRAVLGDGTSLTQLLRDLAALLARQARPGAEGAWAGILARSLAGHAFRPGGGGAELEQALRTAGLVHEARVASVALAELAPREAARLGAELSAGLLAALAGPAPAAEAQSLGAALAAALRSVLLAGAAEGELAQRLESWLGARATSDGRVALPRPLGELLAQALARLPDHPLRERALRGLARSGADELPRAAQRLLLRALLGLPPPEPGAADAAELARLPGDLKAQLLAALAELPEGSLREAVARAAAALDAEQLLNVARTQGKEPQHWTFLLQDGPGWTAAHLFHGRAEEGERPGRQGAGEGAQRVVLALELSSTGPLRADLILRPGSLALRIAVAREEVAARLRERLDELEQLLALGGRRVALGVLVAPLEDLRPQQRARDVAYLREHHLMDLCG